MKRVLKLILPVLLLFANTATPAHAAAPAVKDVGAYFKVEIGFMISWSLPNNLTGVTGYTVTASNGATCTVVGANSNQCTYSTNKVPFPFKPYLPYTFTVVTNSKSGNSEPSAPSNVANWFGAPGYPTALMTKVVSDNQIDLTWVPSTSTGGIPNYGYRVTLWEAQLNAYGDPKNETRKDFLISNTYISLTGLKPSTWYVLGVAQCNALGCSMSDWSYVATTPKVGAVVTWRPPRQINGGNASTTCFDAILSGGTAATTGTVTKSATRCAGVIIDPANYPKINPTATEENIPNLVNKFAQNIFLGGWQEKYSLATWGKLGLTLTPYLTLSSKSVLRGFVIQPVIVSNTPAVCSINGMLVSMLKVGTCTITASAPGNNIWLPSRAMTNSFQIVP